MTSIPALLTALADNSVTSIMVANGTYRISHAGNGYTNDSTFTSGLWIGSRFAARTRAVTVFAETRYGVTFDGGGGGLGCMSFEGGAHDQTWDGFVFANGVVSETGCITFGGYPITSPYNITLRNIKVLSSVRGSGSTAQGFARDHAVYFSQSSGGGPHDLALENFDIDAAGGLASGFHFEDHGDHANQSHDVTFSVFNIRNAQQAILLWRSEHNVLIQDGTITNSTFSAVTYRTPGSNVVIKNVNSTGSGQTGLDASEGTSGLTIINSSLH